MKTMGESEMSLSANRSSFDDPKEEMLAKYREIGLDDEQIKELLAMQFGLEESSGMGGGCMAGGGGPAKRTPDPEKPYNTREEVELVGVIGEDKEEDNSHFISRAELIQEMHLRTHIRKAIRREDKLLRESTSREYSQEYAIRAAVRSLINEVKVVDKIPHESTGINILEQLLKTIVPVIESYYKILTTDKKQRYNFRAHILNGIINAIAPPKILHRNELEDVLGTDAKGVPSAGEFQAPESPEDLTSGAPPPEAAVSAPRTPSDGLEDPDFLAEAEVPMGPPVPSEEEELAPPEATEADRSKFIDIEEPEVDEQDSFGAGIKDRDKTGRNVAYECFQKIEKNIVTAYTQLGNPDDKQMFYIYLLTNMKLYFDRFEDDLQNSLPEPTTKAFEETQTGSPGV